MEAEESLTRFEIERNARIAKNKQRMMEMGVVEAYEALVPNQKLKPKAPGQTKERQQDLAKKRLASFARPGLGARRSSRLLEKDGLPRLKSPRLKAPTSPAIKLQARLVETDTSK